MPIGTTPIHRLALPRESGMDRTLECRRTETMKTAVLSRNRLFSAKIYERDAGSLD